ncbi:MAG: MOSC domain-containing protein [Caulobacter sp.]
MAGSVALRMNALQQIFVGRVAPLGAAVSGIAKQAVQGPVWLGVDGFEGDEQGDRRFHGGPDKAVHHYPRGHYAHWRHVLGDHPLLAGGSAFGENLDLDGWAEDHVAVGDVFRLGEAIVQVTQGRQPCWKLNLRFERPDMARLMQASGRVGWYYRVLKTGWVSPGDRLELTERHSEQWTIAALWRALYITPLEGDVLRAMVGFEGLPDSWRRHAQRRLATGAVEDWSVRLDTPAGLMDATKKP